MADKTGVARLRRAIENQRDAGEACFALPIGEAAAICDECEDELATLLWAKGVPAPRDADGEVVPLTTKAMYGEGGREHDVVGHSSFTYHAGADRWCVNFVLYGASNVSDFHLHRPDSWERLEEDLNLGCRDYCERYRLEECDYNMRAHMFYRAKALAERDAKEADRG